MAKAGTLEPLGTLTYNTYAFPVDAHVRSAAHPVLTSNGLKRKSVQYTFNIIWTISPPNDLEEPAEEGDPPNTQTYKDYTIDSRVESIRRLLMKKGGVFVMKDRGFGPIDTATNGDIGNGPLPGEFSWTPLAGNKAALLEWSVMVELGDCESSSDIQKGIVEFEYETTWNYSPEGQTVRTISGHYMIAAQLVGARMSDVADAYRDQVKFPILPGYQRSSTFTQSADRRRMNFTVTDTEIPSDNPLYPYLVRLDVDYDVSARLDQGGFSMWDATLSGSATVRPGASRLWAWKAFLDVYRQKKEYGALAKIGNVEGGTTRQGGFKVPTAIHIGEQVFGRGVRFSISFRIAASLPYIIAGSGIWRPLQGTDWGTWAASMGDAFGPRGMSNLKHQPSDDIIVSLCDNQSTIPIPATPVDKSIYPGDPLDPWKKSACPPKEASWLSYQNQFRFLHSTQSIKVKRIGPSDLQNYTNYMAAAEKEMKPEGASWLMGFDSQQATANDEFHSNGRSSVTFVMYGYAMRVCYEICPPTLHQVAGATPMLKSRDHQQSVIQSAEGPIYFCRWANVYEMINLPKDQSGLYAAITKDVGNLRPDDYK